VKLNRYFRCAAAMLVTAAFAWTPARGLAGDTGSSLPAPKDQSANAEKSKGAPKFYLYKGQKTTGKDDARTLVVLVEDLATGKSDSFNVQNTDPASGKFDPVKGVVDFLKDLPVDTPIELRTERVKGRPVVTAVEKASLAPGEEREHMFVLVDWDKKRVGQGGKPMMAVKLKKFGREFVAFVPLVKSKTADDWAAPWGVEHALGKVRPGETLEVHFQPGSKTPLVKDMMLYRPPERGKFLEFTQKEMESGVTAAAFKMLAQDGITVTVTLPGVEKMQGTTKVLVPDPKQLRAVQNVKPESEIEITLQPGDRYILRDIKVLSPPRSEAPEAKKS
jgi:hypothetical protein